MFLQHRVLRHLLMLTLCFVLVAPVIALDAIRYPVSMSADMNSRGDYTLEMLRLAVQKSGTKLLLRPVRIDANKIRTLAELEKGNQLDVYWGGASKEREISMLPIRICLMKGLMGWRIPVVTKKNIDLFANVESLGDLQKLTAGQGYHWTDTQILLASDIKVERSYEFEFLFRMLVAGRFDYFPRSVMEVWNEVDAHSQMDVAIDTRIAIHYPAAFYFYVRKNNQELAEIIQRGLETAIKDGSFDKLFYEFHKSEIVKADLDKRRIIELKNPFLPADTPLDRKELWFSVKDLKKIGR